jgi:hypothetical protein
VTLKLDFEAEPPLPRLFTKLGISLRASAGKRPPEANYQLPSREIMTMLPEAASGRTLQQDVVLLFMRKQAITHVILARAWSAFVSACRFFRSKFMLVPAIMVLTLRSGPRSPFVCRWCEMYRYRESGSPASGFYCIKRELRMRVPFKKQTKINGDYPALAAVFNLFSAREDAHLRAQTHRKGLLSGQNSIVTDAPAGAGDQKMQSTQIYLINQCAPCPCNRSICTSCLSLLL